MKKELLAITSIVLLSSAPAFAEKDHDDDHHEEKRQRHFEVKEPNSWAEAIAIVEEKGAEMKAAYLAEDYGKMHELSYSLEVAADYLEEESEGLLEAVEEVHHATEDGETEKLNKKFPELEALLNEIAPSK